MEEGLNQDVVNKRPGSFGKEENERNGRAYDKSEAEPTTQPIGQTHQLSALQKEDILYEIFRCLDNKTLLQCRLVCHLWNYTINNVSALWHGVEVSLGDTEEFLKSSIALKVKKFHLQEGALSKSTEKLEEFVDRISLSAEAVTFDTVRWKEQQQTSVEVFSGIISKCVNLKRLRIISPPQILPFLSEELASKSVITKLEELTLNARQICTHGVIPNLGLLLLKLPELRLIKFVHEARRTGIFPNSTPYIGLVKTFLEHIKRYPGSLKTLSFRFPLSITWTPAEHRSTLFEFLLRAGKQKIAVKWTGGVCLDELTEYIRMQGIKESSLTEDNFGLLKVGYIVLSDNQLHITRKILSLCTGMIDLKIKLVLGAAPGQLRFLEFLNKLRSLSLYIQEPEDGDDQGDLLDWPDGTVGFEGIDLFPPRMPSIERLQIGAPIFNTTAFLSFHNVFTNLTKLLFVCVKNLPEGILASLIKMEYLTKLGIVRSNLTDSMVLQPCEVQSWNDSVDQEEKLELVPAINAFICLKRLEIIACPQLTDLFLVQGIAKSRTLEGMTLSTTVNQFSQEAFDAVFEGGRLRVEAWDETESEWRFGLQHGISTADA